MRQMSDDHDNSSQLNNYSIQIWDFEKVVRARTASKAKYLYWLSFRDAYDMSFKDFLSKVICRKFS